MSSSADNDIISPIVMPEIKIYFSRLRFPRIKKSLILRQGTPSFEDENMKLRTEFRSRIEELEKSRSGIAGENAKRDAIAELKTKVLKLRTDNEVNKQTQDISPEDVNNVGPSFFKDHPSNLRR